MTGPRILLSAYQCAPGQGSVSQIGYEWYSRLAQLTPVTLVTHIRNKPWLEPARIADSEILYIDTEAFAGPLYRTATRLFPRSQHAVFLLSSLDYFAFDRQSRRLLQRMQQQGRNWEIIHCPTPVSPLAVPTLHRLGVPSVLGPWNGGLQSPKTFPEFMKQDSAWLYPLRNLGKVFETLNGGMAHASLIFSATAATDNAIPAGHRSRCVRMLENGVDLSIFRREPWPMAPSKTNPLRVLFVGRLIPAKGVPMLLDAVAQLAKETPVRLTVIGDGPESDGLQQYAATHEVQSAVEFAGARSLPDVAAAMRTAHVFCLPSVRESGGSVLLEAMAAARPVVAVAYGGPREIVDEEVGHAIEPIGRDFVVRDLTLTLRDVVDRPDIWQRKGERGRQRAELEFGWDAKIRCAIGHYHRLFDGRFSELDELVAGSEHRTRSRRTVRAARNRV